MQTENDVDDVEKIMACARLFLLVETRMASGQIFNGRTSKASSISPTTRTRSPSRFETPQRSSSAKTWFSNSHSSVTAIAPLPAAEISGAKNPLDAEREPLATTVVTYALQEVNIVVVNSNLQQPNLHPCAFGGHCKPAFRPDFTDRRYIHPSVFDGSSRCYARR
jgi:hypothetical protein